MYLFITNRNNGLNNILGQKQDNIPPVLHLPLFFVGAYLFGSGPLTHDAQELIFLFQHDLISAVILLKDIILHAVLVWICMAPGGIILLYLLLKPFLKKLPTHRYPVEISSNGFRQGHAADTL